jgi:molybdopterin adenylyltransferase
MSESSDLHHRRAGDNIDQVQVAVVTVSDSRTPGDDANHDYLEGALREAGHRLCAYRLVPDEPAQVLEALDAMLATEAQAVLFNGGTGLSRRDNTYEALAGRLETPIPGFGELFRMLSWEQVGPAAMLSRATAGLCQGRLVVSLPGSPAAVRLAWEKLLAPELRHLVWELER